MSGRATWQVRGGLIQVVRATCSRTAGQDSTGVILNLNLLCSCNDVN